ncbi:hypothetical protein K402DRAFT_452593 [Aulographum hederae CBS 113979]|uniref:FAD-binding PCMH-type domain-containing protein n=1 Tax=Aulographum hederae CBS 113979 TaxID=1176131 RepID=A0A6G1H6K5_9PEZI|nr:hypothetical protein K402DRAFT_452593 [Aulographum hederae CBS 113979]
MKVRPPAAYLLWPEHLSYVPEVTNEATRQQSSPAPFYINSPISIPTTTRPYNTLDSCNKVRFSEAHPIELAMTTKSRASQRKRCVRSSQAKRRTRRTHSTPAIMFNDLAAAVPPALRPRRYSVPVRRQAVTRHTLERYGILRDVLNGVEEYAEAQPAGTGTRDFDIDIQALRDDVLVPVLVDDYDAETQVRGLMRTMRDTDAFSDAFEQLPCPILRHQLTVFMNGATAEEVVAKQGFEPHSETALVDIPTQFHQFQAPLFFRRMAWVLDFPNVLTCCSRVVVSSFSAGGKFKKVIRRLGIGYRPSNLPELYEDEEGTKGIEVYERAGFENWGRTVMCTPRYTFVPKTVLGIQNIVQFAIQKNLRVRCGGFRHSWSDISAEENQILISFVDVHISTDIQGVQPFDTVLGEHGPDPYSVGANVPELKTINILTEELSNDDAGQGKALCRIGAAVTAEEFRRWANKHDKWTLPAETILVEVSYGGTNGSICHGGGRAHKTMNDMVRRIEYVDCHGEKQIVDDPRLIKAAAGSFGLLGVVTHLTFLLDPMSYAVMKPRKTDICLAIPPMNPSIIPPALSHDADWMYQRNAPDIFRVALEDFSRRATDDYYCQWLWFPYQKRCQVNTFNVLSRDQLPKDETTGSGSGSVIDYPSAEITFLQWSAAWIGGVMTASPFFRRLPAYWQAQLLATAGMATSAPVNGEDNTPEWICKLPDALHYRRGATNMRLRDLEIEIPLMPSKEDPNVPDWTTAQRAWWDAINLVYEFSENEKKPSCPLRLGLEMRITGGSDIIMAPQYANSLGFVSVEVLTIIDTCEETEWKRFCQAAIDQWSKYDTGHIKPHWGKEWEGLKFSGLKAKDYFKNVAYKDQIALWREMTTEIGDLQGWNLKDLKKRFSNATWDSIMFPDD